MMNAKELKKLAKACREAGIKHYKCADFEFTLTEEAPEPKKTAAKAAETTSDSPFKSDTPSPEDLLFWSVQTPEASAAFGEDEK